MQSGKETKAADRQCDAGGQRALERHDSGRSMLAVEEKSDQPAACYGCDEDDARSEHAETACKMDGASSAEDSPRTKDGRKGKMSIVKRVLSSLLLHSPKASSPSDAFERDM